MSSLNELYKKILRQYSSSLYIFKYKHSLLRMKALTVFTSRVSLRNVFSPRYVAGFLHDGPCETPLLERPHPYCLYTGVTCLNLIFTLLWLWGNGCNSPAQNQEIDCSFERSLSFYCLVVCFVWFFFYEKVFTSDKKSITLHPICTILAGAYRKEYSSPDQGTVACGKWLYHTHSIWFQREAAMHHFSALCELHLQC